MKRKNKIKIFLAVIFILFSIFITPMTARAAERERGYKAIGGEYALLYITPLALAYIIEVIKDDKKISEEKENTENNM